MKVTETEFPGVLILEPGTYGDKRGSFMETWNSKTLEDAGINQTFVQDNLSFSHRHVLRGMHFQNPNGQGKLVQVFSGEVFDVVVDIRIGSPTFAKWIGITLSDKNKRQLYIPPHFAHGFCVTSEQALFFYKCTDFYNPRAERGLLWNDPAIGIDWPTRTPLMSEKDEILPGLDDIGKELLPHYKS